MDKKTVNLHLKHTEIEIRHMSGMVADALEQLEVTKELLIFVGLALENLYGSLGEPVEEETPPL